MISLTSLLWALGLIIVAVVIVGVWGCCMASRRADEEIASILTRRSGRRRADRPGRGILMAMTETVSVVWTRPDGQEAVRVDFPSPDEWSAIALITSFLGLVDVSHGRSELICGCRHVRGMFTHLCPTHDRQALAQLSAALRKES